LGASSEAETAGALVAAVVELGAGAAGPVAPSGTPASADWLAVIETSQGAKSQPQDE
jgi:hypothetical protein